MASTRELIDLRVQPAAGSAERSLEAHFGDLPNPYHHAAKGDGIADDTGAVQALFDSGRPIVVLPHGAFSCGGLTVPPTVKMIIGPGELRQRAEGADLLHIEAADGLLLDGLRLTGASALNLTQSASGNNGVNVIDSRGVTLRGCTLRRFMEFGAYAQDSEDIRFLDCDVVETGFGLRFNAVVGGRIVGNAIKDTLYDQASVFVVAIGLDADGVAGSSGHCRDITIADNEVSGFAHAQAIMVHAGEWIAIDRNRLRGAAIGIGCVTNGPDDNLFRLSITRNQIECPASAPVTSGNECVNVLAGATHPRPRDILIAGNVGINGNRIEQHQWQGACRLQRTERATLAGNQWQGCWANGVVLREDETHVQLGDKITNVIANAAGVQNAVRTGDTAAVSGLVDGLYVADVPGGIGLNVGVSSPDLTLGTRAYANVGTNEQVG